MDVTHLTFSASGGAGRVATQLCEAQKALGFDAEVLASIRKSLFSSPFELPLTTLAAAFDSYIVSNQKEKTLFGVYRDEVRSPIKFDQYAFRNVHLHWTKGAISTRSISQLVKMGQKAIVWTLHDMAAFTGGCHHAHDCNGYISSCSNCPQVRGCFQNKVSLSLDSKRNAQIGSGRIVFSAPSQWIRDAAQRSMLLRNARIELIENPINDFYLNPATKSEARQTLGISPDEIVGMAIAADLADPNKQIQAFVDEFFRACNEIGVRGKIILIGANAKKILSSVGGIIPLGSKSPNEIVQFAPAADLLGVYSVAETAPLVIAEAAFMGVPTVVRDGNPGALSLATKLPIYFTSRNSHDLGEILTMIKDSELTGVLANLTSKSRELFSSKIVASKFINLYSEIDNDEG